MKILAVAAAAARASVQPVAATPASGAPAVDAPGSVERRKRPRTRIPVADEDDDDADQDEAPPASRPRWLVPAAVAVLLLVAVGVGLTVLPVSPSGKSNSSFVGALFAKRARERSEAEKAAVAAQAGQDAEVIVLDPAPLPPLPVFQPEGPQVQDLDAAIAVIRKELVLANQKAAMAEEAIGEDKKNAAPAGKVADTVAGPTADPGVIQPRERRLTKILELYDQGNPDLSADSLEIFLRDFPDDPISKRILDVKP